MNTPYQTQLVRVRHHHHGFVTSLEQRSVKTVNTIETLSVHAIHMTHKSGKICTTATITLGLILTLALARPVSCFDLNTTEQSSRQGVYVSVLHKDGNRVSCWQELWRVQPNDLEACLMAEET